MIYNLISGKVVIFKLYDEYNIKSRDWENRVPNWILDAISYLNISSQLDEVAIDIEFTNHSFKLPCDIKVLRGVIVDNMALNRVDTVSHQVTNTIIADYDEHTNHYSIDNGYIKLEKETGTATVVYKRVAMEGDDVTGMWIPMIPDIPEVINNITYYVLKIILARGYVHPIYSLSSNNPITNPDLLWRNSLTTAKRKAKAMDAEKRAKVAEINTRFIADPNADTNELFNIRR
ncbi:hypothetical protein DSECCO2_120020 [anaerobic digester metagenome]